MSRTVQTTARRSFLLSGAALGLLLAAAPSALAQPAPALPAIRIDPWMGRQLTTSEKFRLAALGERLDAQLGEAGLQTKMLADHLRLRIPAGLAYVRGKDHLSPEGVALLTLVAEEMLHQVRVRAEIVGHHDARPSAYEAYVFTKRRAQAARATLASRGVDPARIKPTGLGLKFPYLPDPQDSRNQRIEILFRPL